MKAFLLLIILSTLAMVESPRNHFQRLEIYSGQCTLYHKEAVGRKLRYRPISRAFAKLIVNRYSHHLSFYFNNKLVFTRDQFDSYIDDRQGGEGFTSYNGIDAHRFDAERVFQIEVKDILAGNDLGFQYEITNYRMN